MQAVALRAQIALHCASEPTNLAVANELKITHPMVGKWRQPFVERCALDSPSADLHA